MTIAPNMMGAGMSGTTGIGRLESDVSLSASDVFKNLQFGFMGYVEAKKGKWGVGTDIMWMTLGSSTGPPLPARVDVDYGGFIFLAIRELSPRRLSKQPSPSASPLWRPRSCMACRGAPG